MNANQSMPTPAAGRWNPWPVAIISYFAIFISFLVAFIVFAARQRVDLVRTDYYEQELRFQSQIDRVRRAGELTQNATVHYDAARQCIRLTVPSSPAVPATGRIHLYRPSDATLDREIPLAVDPSGTQWLNADGLRSGLWKIQVQWTAGGREFYADRPLVIPAKRS